MSDPQPVSLRRRIGALQVEPEQSELPTLQASGSKKGETEPSNLPVTEAAPWSCTVARDSTLVRSFGLDALSLSLGRICIALVVLSDLLDRSADITALYTDVGVVPRCTTYLDLPHHYFSLYLSVGNATGVAALMLLHAACACALLVGYHTTAGAQPPQQTASTLCNHSFPLLSLACSISLHVGASCVPCKSQRPGKSLWRLALVCDTLLVVLSTIRLGR